MQCSVLRGPSASCVSRAGHRRSLLCSGRTSPSTRSRLVVQALHIDRAKHLEGQLFRQGQKEEVESRWAKDISEGSMLEVADLDELERVTELAGSALVILFLYSRTCGVCKDAAQRFEQLRSEAHRGKARAVFVKHDIETPYGDKSDITRLHNVRAVPCFLFFDEGAMVRRLSLRDIRRLTGPTKYVQAALAEDVRRLKSTFLEMLLTKAPSTRS